MLQRWWFKLYILALITGAVAIIVPMLPIPKSTSPPLVSIPVESLGFYSNSIPIESRFYVSSWLNKNGVRDQSATNITPRQGSLHDTTYRLGIPLQRNVAITMDVKQPNTSFTILVGIDPAGKVPPLTSISCPDSENASKTAKCKEMIRV